MAPNRINVEQVLKDLIENGDAYIDDDHSSIVGIASDGTHVSLGSLYNMTTLEAYLTHFPGPADW